VICQLYIVRRLSKPSRARSHASSLLGECASRYYPLVCSIGFTDLGMIFLTILVGQTSMLSSFPNGLPTSTNRSSNMVLPHTYVCLLTSGPSNFSDWGCYSISQHPEVRSTVLKSRSTIQMSCSSTYSLVLSRGHHSTCTVSMISLEPRLWRCQRRSGGLFCPYPLRPTEPCHYHQHQSHPPHPW